MVIHLENIEEKITDIFTTIFKTLLFFLNGSNQSLVVSSLHYLIFIIGFYYFFVLSKPGDIYRFFFFIFVAFGAISYFIFNKCLFTSIELKLSKEKNLIQKTMDTYFGKEIEGNMTSKVILSLGSLVMGIILLNDYRIL
jgi:hypothetical protein